MPDEFARRPEFGQMLEAEVERILADPTLQRSPVLSRLLRFLRDQTIKAPNKPITQVSIAVDGLGRREDYDQDAESYVRVQISRLRRVLGEYYARHQPGSGLCVYLRHGEYNICLAPPQRAYPEQQHAPPEAYETDAASTKNAPPEAKSISRATIAAVFAVASAIVVIWFATMRVWGWLETTPPPIAEPPRVSVSLANQDMVSSSPSFSNLPRLTEMEVRKVLSSSFVARGAAADPAPDYRLSVYFAPGSSGEPEVFLRLTDADAYVRFAESLPVSEDQEQFLNALNARLAAIFSSSGVIAKDLVRQFEAQDARSDFECFLVSEAERAVGKRGDETLRECLTKYSESQYASFWLALLSYGEYQAAISRGEAVGRNSGGWDKLVAALNLDRFNPLANGVAAKIALAEGDCRRAQHYLARAQARSLADPTINAALFVDALPCFTNPQQQAEKRRALEDMIAANPDAEPRLRLQLVLGALELNKAETAHELLRGAIGNASPDGNVALALGLLDRHFGEVPDKRSSAELQRAITRFVWNPVAQSAIFETLGLDRAR